MIPTPTPRGPRDPQRRGIACAGLWIVDFVHDVDRWPQEGDLTRIHEQAIGVGGGAANVASDLASLGAPFPLAAIGCLGEDEHAERVLAHARRFGLDPAWLQRLPGSATGHTHVISVRGGNRSFFYHAGANDRFGSEHVPIGALAERGFRIFYLGYLLLLGAMDVPLPGGETPASLLLQRVRSAGMATCVDLVSEQDERLTALLAPALPHTDYLVINEAEAERASGVAVRDAYGRLANERLRDAARLLLEGGVRQVVVIHSPELAVWLARSGEEAWAAPQPVAPEEIVSAVGAGDAFCAAVLYGLHEGWPAQATLRRAHLVAAACLRGHTATDGIPPMAEVLRRATDQGSP